MSSHPLIARRHRPAWAAVLLFVLLCPLGCGGAKATEASQDEAQAAEPTPRKPPIAPNAAAARVELAVLEPSTASLETTIPGEVEGSRDAVLASALGGPVERIHVKEGDMVRKGQLLMQVDTAMYAIRKRQAEVRVQSAERNYKRADGLGSALSQAERDRRKDEVDAAKADLDLAKLQLARSRVVAPFAGVVSHIHTEVGEVVAATSPLADLVQLDPVHIVLSVPDRDVVALHEGDEVEVRVAALSGSLPAQITRISDTGDSDTRAFEAEIEVDNAKGQLKPGMIASVDIRATVAEGAVVIPQDWLVTRRDGVGVYLDEDGTARFVSIQPGRIVRNQVTVTEGLEPGMRLVIRGHRDLSDGDALSIAREGICCTDNGRARFE